MNLFRAAAQYGFSGRHSLDVFFVRYEIPFQPDTGINTSAAIVHSVFRDKLRHEPLL
jgi:hypothetical protein